MELKQFIKDLAAKLQAAGIDYCITGGYAVSVWGSPRSTLDIDLITGLEPSQISSLIRAISPGKGAYLDEEAIKEAVAAGGEFNYIPAESGLKVDFWVIRGSDATGLKELKRKKKEVFEGQEIFFISPEDLVLSKLRWARLGGSSRHAEDIRSVVSVSGKALDLAYLKREAAVQGLTADLAPFIL
ncbi:MAG: hypothetical protein A2285_03355 [Elusimicrobia bacterium RIFOXYA12_FULL_57_11]|nr:MAG: hypothetical protein A2285_03355 [Elusimicrobia bacterium RIFOXYA12_FULL_57_11]